MNRQVDESLRFARVTLIMVGLVVFGQAGCIELEREAPDSGVADIVVDCTANTQCQIGQARQDGTVVLEVVVELETQS